MSSAANNKKTTNKAKAASVEKSSSKDAASPNDDNACVVCFKNVDIFSIGECDHPVCYECSTRMRVLCQQNECPICRHVLSKVIFTAEKQPYRELEAKNRSEYYSKKYKICFYTSRIQQAFFDLLNHPCPKCDCEPYRTFQGLRHHVRKEHELHYCDICVEHLKIFTFERRCYTQAELGMHRTKGDVDNRSHRGHPLCEYCNNRYLDRDELFRHLRREHYYCHFCDADGCNEFYKDYKALAEHFRQDHFLCEEGDCANEQFISFRTEIDYKAHVANVHGKNMNKQQAKQTRTLQLEITLGPRGRSGQTEQGIANLRSRGAEQELHEEPEEYLTVTTQGQRSTIDARNEQDFPSLGGAGPNVNLTPAVPLAMRNRATVSGLARTKENFPALGGSSAASSNNASTVAASRQNTQPISSVIRKQGLNVVSTGAIPRVPSTAAMTGSNATPANSGMFISVSSTTPSSNGSSNSNTKKAKTSEFPALPASKNSKKSPPPRPQLKDETPNNNGMFIHVSNRPKTSNSGNAAVTPTSNKKPMVADFPALPASNKAPTKKSPPPRQTAASTAANSNNSMFLHVSNRPKSTNSNANNSNSSVNNGSKKDKAVAMDFPSLSVSSAKSKKSQQARQQLEEDMGTYDSQLSMSNISAKHRTLVDDYVSVANSNHFQKIQMVQKEEMEAKNRQKAAKANAPSLTSMDFPSLGGGNVTAPVQWVKLDQKAKEAENRKSKVAPAPQLPNSLLASKKAQNSSSKGLNGGDFNPTPQEAKNKKKYEQQLSQQSNSSNGKNSERNNNNLEAQTKNFNGSSTSLSSIISNNNNNNNSNNSNKTKASPSNDFHSNVTLKSVAKSPNNLTFTTSLGESYSIIPTHSFTQPPDAQIRNQNLVIYFQDIMESPEALDEFRYISQQFREGIYKASAFYEHCQAAMKNRFDLVFPELLVLLPDISKQQELYLIHQQHEIAKSSAQRTQNRMGVCSYCKQVVLDVDMEYHQKMHELKENFPTLGAQKAAGRK